MKDAKPSFSQLETSVAAVVLILLTVMVMSSSSVNLILLLFRLMSFVRVDFERVEILAGKRKQQNTLGYGSIWLRVSESPDSACDAP